MLWWTKSRRAQSVDDFETWIAGGVCPTLNAFDMGDIRATVLIIDGAISEQHNTLRAAGRHATGALQGSVVRRLTPIECERLQGFPDDWTAEQADSHRYKQCGNAVTVNVIAWIGARL